MERTFLHLYYFNMKVNPFDFAKALFQYLQKSDLSTEEKTNIESVIKNSPEIQSLCKEMGDKEMVDRQLSIILSFDVDEAYRKVKPKTSKSIGFYLKTAAAVAILAVVTLFTYNLLSDESYDESQIGSGKSILKTSDGRVMSLDTLSTLDLANNMELYNESGTLFVKEKEHKDSETKRLNNTLDVPYKGMHNIVLPDGSRVTLNSGSTLEFADDFLTKERVVTLNGEGFFDVAKYGDKPFIVKTKDVSIRVLGTKFNVKSYENELNTYTTLVEGEIELLKDNEEMKILPGEQVVFDRMTKALDVKLVNVAPVVAWSDKMFYFDETPLEDILNRMCRWYDLKVKYLTDASKVKMTTYSGKVKMYSRPEDVLTKFEKTGDLKFELKNNTIIISK